MFTVIRTIGAVTRAIQTDSNQHFKQLGLNNNLFIYIIRICEKPGMFMAELAEAIQIDRTTAFRTIQKLAERGYFELRDDAHNQKIKRIFPTQKAAAIYPQLHDYEQQQSDYLLADLSSSEQKELARLLSKLKY
ncbi:MarR family transcriptional regulator [Streptococcus chenjunshii]|uniref:MarR family transcriptional regulator n=1 Tax=Streptococcus chenjunshii TaxID=2173853 RepID=A0A372KNR2_9STRE|nr:MarR family transcriptional regulator [Streptococcus chenjunshii]AXQ77920.1 MarR family transcriptional regulator [Streptococcus chenjunshii]RFU51837.1 MarR family transcriptional regulator [Streptococcus chenjunshii]RFU53925.1 MarR family transcriptional regulator [Streptococcus chenjunshii]